MPSIPVRPVSRLLALACAAAPVLALAQRPELPPVQPAATRPVAARAVGASTLAVTTAATAVKAAQVQIVDDEAHAPFKEGVFATCSIAGVCTVPFSTVPAGHRRIVEHLSCSVYVSTTGALRYVAFLANSFTPPPPTRFSAAFSTTSPDRATIASSRRWSNMRRVWSAASASPGARRCCASSIPCRGGASRCAPT